jgi:hypothetical protein
MKNGRIDAKFHGKTMIRQFFLDKIAQAFQVTNVVGLG